MLDKSTAWHNSARISKHGETLLRFYYGAQGANDFLALTTATGGLTVEGVFYRGFITVPPETTEGFDLFTHISEVGDVMIEIQNGEYFPGKRLSDVLEDPSFGDGSTDYGIENRRAWMKVWSSGIDVWADCLETLDGKTRNIKHNDQILSIRVQDDSATAHKQLPRTKIKLADFANAPGESIGLPIPITIGSMLHAPGVVTDSRKTVSNFPVVHFDDTAYAINGLKAFNEAGQPAQGPLHFFDAGRYYFPHSDTLETLGDDLMPAASAINLLQADSNSITGWAGTNANLSSVTSIAFGSGTSLTAVPLIGTYVMQIVGTAADGQARRTITVVAGDTHELRFHILRDPTGLSTPYVAVGTSAGARDLGIQSSISVAQWLPPVIFRFKVPAGVTTIHITIGGVENGDTVWVDASYVKKLTFATTTDYTFGATQLTNGRINFNARADKRFRVGVPLFGDDLNDLDWGPTSGDSENVIDQDVSTNSEIFSIPPFKGALTSIVTIPQGFLQGKKATLYAMLKAETFSSDHSNISIRAGVPLSGINARPNIYSLLIVNSTAGSVGTLTFNNITGSDSLVSVLLGDLSIGREQMDMEYTGIVEINGAPSAESLVRFFELGVYILVFAADHERFQWYGVIDGRKDDGGGTYTGSADALIENAADVMHLLADNDLAVSEIDTAAFVASRAQVGNIDFAFSINEFTGSEELFGELGKESHSYTFFKPGAAFSIFTVEDNYSSSDRTIDLSTAIKGSVDFDRTPLEEIITRETVQYDFDKGLGTFSAETTPVNDTDQRDRYKVSAEESEEIFEAFFLRGATAATALGNFRLFQWKQQHNLIIASFGIEQLDIAAGTIVDFTNPPYKPRGLDITITNSVNGQDVYPYWLIYNVKRSSERITLLGFQLHNLTPPA